MLPLVILLLSLAQNSLQQEPLTILVKITGVPKGTIVLTDTGSGNPDQGVINNPSTQLPPRPVPGGGTSGGVPPTPAVENAPTPGPKSSNFACSCNPSANGGFKCDCVPTGGGAGGAGTGAGGVATPAVGNVPPGPTTVPPPEQGSTILPLAGPTSPPQPPPGVASTPPPPAGPTSPPPAEPTSPPPAGPTSPPPAGPTSPPPEGPTSPPQPPPGAASTIPPVPPPGASNATAGPVPPGAVTELPGGPTTTEESFQANDQVYIACTIFKKGDWIPKWDWLKIGGARVPAKGRWREYQCTYGKVQPFQVTGKTYDDALAGCKAAGYDAAQPSTSLFGNWYPFQVNQVIKDNFSKGWTSITRHADSPINQC